MIGLIDRRREEGRPKPGDPAPRCSSVATMTLTLALISGDTTRTHTRTHTHRHTRAHQESGGGRGSEAVARCVRSCGPVSSGGPPPPPPPPPIGWREGKRAESLVSAGGEGATLERPQPRSQTQTPLPPRRAFHDFPPLPSVQNRALPKRPLPGRFPAIQFGASSLSPATPPSTSAIQRLFLRAFHLVSSETTSPAPEHTIRFGDRDDGTKMGGDSIVKVTCKVASIICIEA